MIRQRNAAVRTVNDRSALFAADEVIIAAAIDKQHRLLFFLVYLDELIKKPRTDGRGVSALRLGAHIVYADLGKRRLSETLGKLE